MKKLTGMVAIVTGASRGLGKDIALGLAEYGAAVVIAARTETEKEGLPGTIYKTVEQIQQMGEKSLAVPTDVTSEESVQHMVQKTLDKFGRIDILVNNAGIAIYTPTVDMPLKRWDLVMRVNLYGTFICSKAVLPSMMKQKSGSIINITTHGRRTVEPSRLAGESFQTAVAYETSKGGIERFTTAMATELSEFNIAVNCIKPEYGVATEGMKFWHPERDWSGWASSDAMVKAAVFLAMQDASGVNGIVITAEELAELHSGVFPWCG
jgi:citronellol/citronellal dehydrogenase